MPHGNLAKSGLPKEKAFGELLPVFQPEVGLPRPHDYPRLSKEASHSTGWVSSEEKQIIDSGLKDSKGNIQNNIGGMERLRGVLLITFLSCLTFVSFGKTDRRFLITQSIVWNPRNYSSCLWLWQSPSTNPSHPALNGGREFADEMHPLHQRTPELGCLLPSIASALTTWLAMGVGST